MLKTIEQPQCVNDFLRFLIGVPGVRRAQRLVEPLDKTKKPYHINAKYDVPVFNLLGFGSTLEKAQKMAQKRAKELGMKI